MCKQQMCMIICMCMSMHVHMPYMMTHSNASCQYMYESTDPLGQGMTATHENTTPNTPTHKIKTCHLPIPNPGFLVVVPIFQWWITWGTHPADKKGYELLYSPENTRDRPEITWHVALGTWHLARGTWQFALGTGHVAIADACDLTLDSTDKCKGQLQKS